MATNYYSVSGHIIGERNVGGSRTNYAADSLGSVVATLVAGAIQNNYANKPYGALLQKSGLGPDPSFGWIGTSGYRQTSRLYAEEYVRSRTYSSNTSRWTAKDPTWPREYPYCYVNGKPVSVSDPNGLGGPGGDVVRQRNYQGCPWYIMLKCGIIHFANRQAILDCCADYLDLQQRKRASPFVPPPLKGISTPQCDAFYITQWHIANEGCGKVCSALMCEELPWYASKECDLWCADQCQTVTKSGISPKWAVCGMYPKDPTEPHSCGDCCQIECGHNSICLDNCGVDCCGSY